MEPAFTIDGTKVYELNPEKKEAALQRGAELIYKFNLERMKKNERNTSR